jgi:hypothetical protein
VKIYGIEIIFKSHEPFQSYKPVRLVRPGQLAGNFERARGN